MNRRRVPAELPVLIGLLIGGFLLGRLQSSFRDKGRPDPVTFAIAAVTRPFTGALASAGTWTSNFVYGVGHAAAMKAQLARLQAENAGLQHEQDQVQLLQSSLLQLRKLQGFPDQLHADKAAANIVGYYPRENRITLDVGTDKGVKPNMPVITGAGLLGVVQTASAHQSQVLLITSPAAQIGAIALRTPPSVGILHGQDLSTLVLDLVDPKSNVQVGDDVTTSGLSDYIPRGIPIGRVIRIEDNPDFGTRRAFVFPWASIGASTEVFVIK